VGTADNRSAPCPQRGLAIYQSLAMGRTCSSLFLRFGVKHPNLVCDGNRANGNLDNKFEA
jgi:hypothetical protein